MHCTRRTTVTDLELRETRIVSSGKGCLTVHYNCLACKTIVENLEDDVSIRIHIVNAWQKRHMGGDAATATSNNSPPPAPSAPPHVTPNIWNTRIPANTEAEAKAKADTEAKIRAIWEEIPANITQSK